jgi:hypothetical protein
MTAKKSNLTDSPSLSLVLKTFIGAFLIIALLGFLSPVFATNMNGKKVKEYYGVIGGRSNAGISVLEYGVDPTVQQHKWTLSQKLSLYELNGKGKPARKIDIDYLNSFGSGRLFKFFVSDDNEVQQICSMKYKDPFILEGGGTELPKGGGKPGSVYIAMVNAFKKKDFDKAKSFTIDGKIGEADQEFFKDVYLIKAFGVQTGFQKGDKVVLILKFVMSDNAYTFILQELDYVNGKIRLMKQTMGNTNMFVE